jgi:V/A-type H+-transporting ATPase subunit D
MNLLTRKVQIDLAIEGAELLRNKRDALIREFFGLARPLLDFRTKLAQLVSSARLALLEAQAMDGPEQVRSVALACKREVELNIQEQNIWGITLPEVAKTTLVRTLRDRGYSVVGTSSRIDEAAENYEKVLDMAVEMASLEIKLRRLGTEIRKTTRRVNALEQRVIPELREQVKFIEATLEQREREDIFRLKRLKKKGV